MDQCQNHQSFESEVRTRSLHAAAFLLSHGHQIVAVMVDSNEKAVVVFPASARDTLNSYHSIKQYVENRAEGAVLAAATDGPRKVAPISEHLPGVMRELRQPREGA